LHGQIVLVSCGSLGSSDPEMVVRAEGFEPTSLAALEPKSSASASSATPAKGNKPKPDTPGRRGLYHAFPAAHHRNG
jgi:hypothetical protein